MMSSSWPGAIPYFLVGALRGVLRPANPEAAEIALVGAVLPYVNKLRTELANHDEHRKVR